MKYKQKSKSLQRRGRKGCGHSVADGGSFDQWIRVGGSRLCGGVQWRGRESAAGTTTRIAVCESGGGRPKRQSCGACRGIGVDAPVQTPHGGALLQGPQRHSGRRRGTEHRPQDLTRVQVALGLRGTDPSPTGFGRVKQAATAGGRARVRGTRMNGRRVLWVRVYGVARAHCKERRPRL